MSWLRLYTDTHRDRKLRRLPPAQRWLWIAVLDLAKESPEPGWLYLSRNVPVTPEDLADEAAIDIDDVREGIEKFIEQNMVEEVDGVLHVVNWDKRQFRSDNSTERVRRYRERKRKRGEKRDVTSRERSNGVAETRPENREQNSDPETDASPPKSPPSDELEKQTVELVRLYHEYSPVTGKKAAGMNRRRNLEIAAALKAGCPPDLLAEVIREKAAAGAAPWEVRELACKRAGIGARDSPDEWFTVPEEFAADEGDPP